MSVSTALAELTRCTYRSTDKKGDPTMGPPMKRTPGRDATRQRYSMRRPAGGRPDQPRRFEVEPRFRDLGQLLVRGLLLVKVPLQYVRAIVAAELLRPGDQRPHRAIS